MRARGRTREHRRMRAIPGEGLAAFSPRGAPRLTWSAGSPPSSGRENRRPRASSSVLTTESYAILMPAEPKAARSSSALPAALPGCLPGGPGSMSGPPRRRPGPRPPRRCRSGPGAKPSHLTQRCRREISTYARDGAPQKLQGGRRLVPDMERQARLAEGSGDRRSAKPGHERPGAPAGAFAPRRPPSGRPPNFPTPPR